MPTFSYRNVSIPIGIMPSSRRNFKRSFILESSQKFEVVRRLREDKQNPIDVIQFIKTEYNRTVTVKYIQSITSQFRKANRVNREPFSDTVYYDLPDTSACFLVLNISFVDMHRKTTQTDFYFETYNSTRRFQFSKPNFRYSPLYHDKH